MRIERIKQHFEEEAKEFDEIIKKLIPFYGEMVEVLISVIPFSKNKKISVIDLGSGTGTISKSIQDHFENIDITCVDISAKMLEVSKQKLGDKVKCIEADLNHFEFPQKYDLIVSSLALHHLENDADKLHMYQKIYHALNDNGVFINIDVVLASDPEIQSVYLQKWQEYMKKSISAEEIENKWMKTYHEEDRPTTLINHLEMLKESHFAVYDVIYKYYNYSIYMAKK